MSEEMIEERTLEEFRSSGLAWWINRSLHLFGWALVFEFKEDKIVRMYPARCRFRGFDDKSEVEGFRKVTEYIEKNIDTLKRDSQ